MGDYGCHLEQGGLYHVFNRANGDEKLFREETNYEYFLHKYGTHIKPVAETLAWCLLPNHFHFLIRLRSAGDLNSLYLARYGVNALEESALPRFVMQQFSNWQNGYAKAYNKMYQRKGALLMNSIRRVEIVTDKQLGNTVAYIHNNAVKHGLVSVPEQWRWSSYHEYVNNQLLRIDSKEIIEWFGTVQEFVRYHRSWQAANL